MTRFLNPEDLVLVLTVLASLATFPAVIAIVARIFHIQFSAVFNREIWTVAGQILGIVIFTLLLIQVGIDSDGLGAKLIYGRF